VISTPGFGDVLLATPLLRSLRRAYAGATLHVLVHRGREGVLEGNPDVDEVLTIAKRPRLREQAALLRRIARRYDLALAISRSERPIWYAAAAARWRAALLPRGRRPKDWWKRALLQGWVEVDEATHVVLQTLRFADLLGIERSLEAVPPRPAQPPRAPPGPYAVLHLEPKGVYKRWTEAGWAALASYLAGRGLALVVTGAEEDRARPLPEGALRDAALDLRGRLRFAELTVLLERCALFVGPDTSVTHLAAMVGAPTVAVYGPTNLVKWGPWPRGAEGRPPFEAVGTQRAGNVLVVQGACPCIPRGQKGCEDRPGSRSACLDELPAAQVIAAARTLLGELTPALPARA
jgi:heptosyltransferase-3